MAATRPIGQLDSLEQTVNEVLIHIGKTIRAQTKGGRRTVALTSAGKIQEANNTFNSTLDVIEADILRAKATLCRDLELLRAQKTAAAVAATSKSEPPLAVAVQQAPPAPMDADMEEPPSTAVNTIAESQSGAAASNGQQAAMAPVPNMDLDSPTAVMSTLPVMAAAANPPATKPPVIKRESPSQTTKPIPTPIANKAVVAGLGGSVTAPIKTASPLIAKVPSPEITRPTAPPVVPKAPSPVLIKSAATLPVAIKASPQPSSPGPGPGPAPATASKAISLSSSSSSPIMITSPVISKMTTSTAVKGGGPAKSALPQTAVPPPHHAQATAPVSATAASAMPTSTSAENANMSTFFDLEGPGDQENHDLGFTDMQFTLVPENDDDVQNLTKHTPLLPLTSQQQHRQQQQQLQPKNVPNAPPSFQTQLPSQPQQSPVQDDSEFDVEKFAADAAQNLMLDTAFPSGQAGTGKPQSQPQQPQQSQQPKQSQQQSQPHKQITQEQADNPTADSTSGADNGDDLFKFIDDPGDLLGEDPTTSFDELYIGGGTDSIDIDSYFDS